MYIISGPFSSLAHQLSWVNNKSESERVETAARSIPPPTHPPLSLSLSCSAVRPVTTSAALLASFFSIHQEESDSLLLLLRPHGIDGLHKIRRKKKVHFVKKCRFIIISSSLPSSDSLSHLLLFRRSHYVNTIGLCRQCVASRTIHRTGAPSIHPKGRKRKKRPHTQTLCAPRVSELFTM